MYTLVLAAALTAGNEVPDFGRRGGCHGCWGGCHGCWGGCHGCWGGCYGCWGGCYGCWGGCYGCWGGCYGGCFGCFGCGGGSVVVVPAAGGVAARPAAAGSGASSVTQTLQDIKKSIEELKKEQNQLRQSITELKRKQEAAAPDPKRGKLLLKMPADALVLVNDKRIDAASVFRTPPLEPGKEQVLNVEAAVVRDGKSINRVKRLSIHAGQVVRLAYKDMAPADERWTESGERPSPAHITVRLPADARLSVHGVACPLTSETRVFDTPALAPGQKYYYLLKAEVVRKGRPIAQTRRVVFRAGERITVSFEDLGANQVTAR